MSMFSEKPAEAKLLLTLLTFGVTLGGSIGVCWLTGSDPWGEVLARHARFAHALNLDAWLLLYVSVHRLETFVAAHVKRVLKVRQ